MRNIEVIALTGLDAAIIGTALIDGREVLAYSFDKCVALIMDRGHDEEFAESFLTEAQNAGVEGAPVFVFLDSYEETDGIRAPKGTSIH